jgi:hypothetical protein
MNKNPKKPRKKIETAKKSTKIKEKAHQSPGKKESQGIEKYPSPFSP